MNLPISLLTLESIRKALDAAAKLGCADAVDAMAALASETFPGCYSAPQRRPGAAERQEQFAKVLARFKTASTLEELDSVATLETWLLDAYHAALIPAEPEQAPAPALERYAQWFPTYNERRLSKPWIARVTRWPVGAGPCMEFGRLLGQPGEDGDVEILARPGDVIRVGQKDHRRPDRSLCAWFVARPGGQLEPLADETAARAAYAPRA